MVHCGVELLVRTTGTVIYFFALKEIKLFLHYLQNVGLLSGVTHVGSMRRESELMWLWNVLDHVELQTALLPV